MTSEAVENILSVRHWAKHILTPTLTVLIFTLVLIRFLIDEDKVLNQSAIITAFLAVYFILIRAGHMYLVRSLHMELKRKFASKYEAKLADLGDSLARRNLGFALSRIKSELMRDKNS